LIATHELSPPNEFTNGQYIPDEEKFYFRAVSSHEIRRALMSYSSNKAPGSDKVTMSVIKDALPGKYLKSFHFQKMEIMRYQIIIDQSHYFLLRQRFVSVLL